MGRRFIGYSPHFSSQGIDLLYELAFGNPSNRGIARHVGDRIEINGKEEYITPHSGCRQRRFAPCMTTTHDDDIKGRQFPILSAFS